jgi:hypothetical protein
VTETRDDEDLWDVNRTARFLKMTPNGLRQWLVKGEGPPSYKVGALRRFRPSEVERWLQQRRDTGAA